AALHRLVKLMGRVRSPAAEVGIAQLKIKLVQFPPHQGVDRSPDAARVSPSTAYAGDNAAGIVQVEREPVADDGLAGEVDGTFGGRHDLLENGRQSAPLELMRAGEDAAQIEFEVETHIEQAGYMLGTLQVATHPEEGI